MPLTKNVGQECLGFGAERPLDFFIAGSSVSGDCGNRYQDTMASYRRIRGRKAVAVNLGITRDVVVSAESAGLGNNLSRWEDVIGIHEPAVHVLQRDGDGAEGGDDPCPAQVCTGLGSEDLMAAHDLSLPYYFADPRLGPLAVRTNVVTQAAAAGEQGASLALRLTGAILDAL